MTAEEFGQYRLDELLGHGGMGEVFRAYDTRRERVVALKRLRPEHAENPEYRARFRRESALVAKLNEPHVIPIHDYGEIDGTLFLDMRLVDGVDLAALLRSGPLPPDRAVEILSQVADALDAAHAANLVHRDVKPSNVLLVGAGGTLTAHGKLFAYLVDFGIARTLGEDTTISRAGVAVGTFAYMAPERLREEPWDHRVDIYALACMLYECLTGRKPFPTDNLAAMMIAHINQPRPLPSAVDPALGAFDDVIVRGMAREPEDRYPSAGAMALDAVRTAQVAAAAPGVPRPVRVPIGPSGADAVDSGRLPSAAAPSVSPPDQDGAAASGSGHPTAPTRPSTSAQHPSLPLPVAGRVVRSRRRWWLLLAGATALVTALAIVIGQLTATGPQVAVGAGASGVVAGPDGAALYVADPRAGQVAVISAAGMTAARPISLPGKPVAVAGGGHRIYVAQRDPGAIVTVDPASGAVIGAPIAVGSRPIALAGAATTLVVVLEDGSAAVVDARTGAVRSVGVGGSPVAVAISSDGSRAWLAGSGPDGGTVVVLDLATASVTARIPVGRAPGALAVLGDDRRVYVANKGDNTVSVIETASSTVLRTVRVGAGPNGVAVTGTLGRGRVYVTNQADNTFSVIDTVTNGPVGDARAVGGSPVGIAVAGETVAVLEQGGGSTVTAYPA